MSVLSAEQVNDISVIKELQHNLFALRRNLKREKNKKFITKCINLIDTHKIELYNKKD
jgi:hypothetical protein